MTDLTDRLSLPLLAAGQAQKELTHNEALTLADMLVQPVVQAVAPSAVPVSPSLGQCWIVGMGATGAWAGHSGALACWTAGGWRFVAPFDGMSVWNLATSSLARRNGASWTVGEVNAAIYKCGGAQVVGARQAAIGSPSGGATVDAEARLAINAVLAAMRSHGLINP